jgi:hypothetical protein
MNRWDYHDILSHVILICSSILGPVQQHQPHRRVHKKRRWHARLAMKVVTGLDEEVGRRFVDKLDRFRLERPLAIVVVVELLLLSLPPLLLVPPLPPPALVRPFVSPSLSSSLAGSANRVV